MSLPFLKNIPPNLKKFLLRSIIVFVAWKLLYHLVLYPIRIPDKQLTHITAYTTQKLVQLNYPNDIIRTELVNHPLPKENVFKNNKKIVGIADGCNGLELYILYIGFLVCFPHTTKKLFVFAITGIATIFILNTIRSYVITLLNINGSSVSEVAHHYIFKIIIYGVMFLLWVKYTRLNEKNEH
ncbi:MAG: archaeosortase/exosortase family protein [Chitinophagales bacterium]|nr:archaeosortase/exosortase family protein [Chitinophagales bacterium]